MGTFLYRLSCLPAVARLAVHFILIKPTVQVQALENKLDGRGDAGGATATIELINGPAESAHFGKLVDILHRGEIITYLHIQAALETGHHLLKLAHLKVLVKDFKHGIVDELLHDAFFFDITHRIKLDLATGRGNDGGQIADTRRNLALFQTQRAAAGIAQHILEVGDRHTHADARTLADVVAVTRQLCDVGNHFLHELWEDDVKALGNKVVALGLHDRNFVFDGGWIVRANL